MDFRKPITKKQARELLRAAKLAEAKGGRAFRRRLKKADRRLKGGNWFRKALDSLKMWWNPPQARNFTQIDWNATMTQNAHFGATADQFTHTRFGAEQAIANIQHAAAMEEDPSHFFVLLYEIGCKIVEVCKPFVEAVGKLAWFGIKFVYHRVIDAGEAAVQLAHGEVPWKFIMETMMFIVGLLMTKPEGRLLMQKIASMLYDVIKWPVYFIGKMIWKVCGMLVDLMRRIFGKIAKKQTTPEDKEQQKKADELLTSLHNSITLVEAAFDEDKTEIEKTTKDMNPPDARAPTKEEEKVINTEVKSLISKPSTENHILNEETAVKRMREDSTVDEVDDEKAIAERPKKQVRKQTGSKPDRYTNWLISEEDKQRYAQDEMRRKAASVPSIFLTDLGLEKYAPKPTSRITWVGEQTPNRVVYDSSALNF